MPEKSAEALPIELSLALPCYNEEACLYRTATTLFEAFGAKDIGVELVLVDNGSADGTGAVIDDLIEAGYAVQKVVVPVNLGYGHGVLEGLRQAQADWVGFICADGQVGAEDVVRLFESARHGQGPLLVKVRRRFRMDGLKRKVVSIAYNLGITALFGHLGSIDINGNPKIFPRSAYLEMQLTSKDWFLDAEVMLKAKAMGLPVLEQNVMAHMRQGGVSNVRASTCLEFAENLLRYRIKPW